MNAGTVYHIFPGRNEHHVLSMIRSFHQNAAEMGVDPSAQRYIVCGVLREQEHAYRSLGPGPEELRLFPDLRLEEAVQKEVSEGGRLVFHSGFYPGMWGALLRRPALLSRTAVVFWGAELIPIFRRSWAGAGWRRLPRHFIRRLVTVLVMAEETRARRKVLPFLRAVCTLTPGEIDGLKARDQALSNGFPLVYQTHPRDLRLAPMEETFDHLRVIVGNSAHESGRHHEVLRLLSRFPDNRLRLICPLGYPRDSDYKDRLIRRGQRLFKSRFVPLREMIPLADYHRFLDSAAVFVVNARRQQGLYGVYYALLRGIKVYLSSASPTYRMLAELGIRVFDVRSIAASSFSEFRAFSVEDRRRNHEIAERLFSLPAALQRWRALFARLGSPEKGA